jgi:Ca-activated chloride channel family protein
VSIVVYAGAAGMVLDATSGNYQERIINAIDRLQAGGSTAGGAGIQLAYQVARANFIPNGNNRVILATDGDFNVGVSNDNDLTQMIENYRDQGIYLTVLGFGIGNLKDSKMEKLADKGNGNYFYIDNINEGRKVLVNELGSTLFTIAKDVKVQVEFNPATVESYRLVGYENRTLAKEDFNDDIKDAGEMGAGHSVTALYEIIPTGGYPQSQGRVDPLVYQKSPIIERNVFASLDVMTVKLRYKDPKGTTSKLIKKTVSRNDIRANMNSENMRLASAVAEFGLLLRNSPYRGIASFDHVINEVSVVKSDKFGYQSEFLDLVGKAKSLSPYSSPVPLYADPSLNDRYENPQSTHEKGQK